MNSPFQLPQVETPTPLHGAAWLVIYNHVQPDYVASASQGMMAKARIKELREWAATAWYEAANPDLSRAYLWALDDIERRVDGRMAAAQLGAGVMAAMRTIQMPPGVDAEPWMQQGT